MDGFAELIERKRQGSLKVYLGYAAGVGKTYAMLQEGLRGSFLLDFLYEAVGVDVHVANVTPKYIK